MKNKVGRPLKFTKKELETKIDQYFKDMDEKKEPYTVTELAYYLDTDRDTLLRYEKKEESKKVIEETKEEVLEEKEGEVNYQTKSLHRIP